MGMGLNKKSVVISAHISGAHNVIADSESKKFQDASKWMISDKTLQFMGQT